MRCSECSRDVKPIVAIDIDGVLGRYHEQFTDFAGWYTGVARPHGYDGATEFSDYLNLPKEEYRQIKLAYRQGGVKRWMPTYDGATEFMQFLSKLGVEIWIASTRPWDRLDNIDPDTRHWLQRNEMPFDYMIYGDDKYAQLVQQVDSGRVIAIIEDLQEQCLIAQALFGGVVWQPRREHTAGQMFYQSFVEWRAILQTIKRKVKDWNATREVKV
jgi:hypothetical protein